MPTDFSRTWPVVKASPTSTALRQRISQRSRPTLLGEQVEAALHREVRLVGAEAAHRAAGRVVGVDGERLDVDVRHPVGAAGVAGGALEHLAADRGVGAGVADHARPHRGQPPLGVAADGVVHADRVALGVHADRLLARRASAAPAGRSARRAARSAPGSTCPPCRRRRRRWAPARRTPARAGRRARSPPGGGRRRCPGPGCTRWRRPSGSGSANALSGSRKRCSMRCVRQVPETTWALAASAASASPRRITERGRRLSWRGLTRGAPGASAASGSAPAAAARSRRRTSAAAARAVRRVDRGDRGEHVADAAHLLAGGDEAPASRRRAARPSARPARRPRSPPRTTPGSAAAAARVDRDDARPRVAGEHDARRAACRAPSSRRRRGARRRVCSAAWTRASGLADAGRRRRAPGSPRRAGARATSSIASRIFT